MPFYVVSSKKHLSHQQCQAISNTITDVHVEITQAPPEFVNVTFTFGRQTNKGSDMLILANVRNGGNRNEESLEILRRSLLTNIAQTANLPERKLIVQLTGVPASWNMEGGEILPEPGSEKGWLNNSN